MSLEMEVRPVSPAIGAEIKGIDLSQMGDEAFSAVKQAFADNGVLFFRNQTLSPDQHIALAERFGDIVVNRFFTPTETHPQIAEVRKEPHHKRNIGSRWHTDHSYDEAPALGSILVARELPQTGGDTLFAGVAAAYDALSDGLKSVLLSLKAWHSSRHSFGYRAEIDWKDNEGRLQNPDAAVQDALHPVVITHPLSGRKCLYVNPEFTTHFDGWTAEESKPLLEFLYAHIARPEFTCRFRWEDGSVAIWDNRATQHCALNDYTGHRRLMHRVTIAGVPLS
ncbi:MAG: TauD/TfdA family dioxygenase [Alphaproteobacteria bacterium]